MIQKLCHVAMLPFKMLEDFAAHNLPIKTKRMIYESYVFNIYSRYYLRYKFLSFKLKHKLNMSTSDLTVHLLLTYNCNFHCKHCEANAGDKIISELSTDEICNLVTELSKMKIKKIYLTGGEPLVRKDVFKIIRHILDEGMEYSIGSNGYFVTEFQEEFRNMKPSSYFASIDGLEQTSDNFRGKIGAFRKSLQALEFFKSIGVKDMVVNTVVIPENIEQLPELKKIIMNSAANYWRFSIPIYVGRAKNNKEIFLNDEQVRHLFDFVEETNKEFPTEISEDAGYLGCLDMKIRSRPFFCGAGLTRVSIMPDGEVLGCQLAYDNRFSEGNIRNKSFKEIWQTGFSRFRDPQLEKKECITCKYVDSCRGGCWGVRLLDGHCYKRIWEKKCHT